ncbi:glycosyltransferase family 4 protein [Flavobacterium branchiicola]|uniref:Glycosyltransferase family 4 protein n=1 Tax=Flavobacterium branchiicola TaxID=1114875 RepID=A0ABV9PEZ9_9FLAO|nr:glycosyltransferase family 1 protein [Flavobacterium branchiicola]MBS7254395.1 glycosyltransferase family 4 protein [Flavobacterium branchiicola]
MKIRIIVDAHIFDHSFQGTATYIHGLYTTLVENEHVEITLAAHNINHLRTIFTDSRFKFVSLKSSSSYKRLLFEYPKLIKEGKYDYAHFQYVVPFFKHTRFINTIHDVLFLKFKDFFPWSYRVSRGIFFRFSAKRSDVILTVSNYSRKHIAHDFKIKETLIHVTPNAVNSLPITTSEIKTKFGIRPYLLFVSRFEPRKNHIGLLNCYLSLKLYEQGLDLVFIGSKKEQIEIEAYYEVIEMIPQEVKGFIHFYEGLDHNTLSSFYKEATCFVFPSFAEGFGIPPIEAALAGCKVLCSNLTSMSDFSFFKYLFNPHEDGEMEEQLMRALNDEYYPFETIKEQVQLAYNWKKISEDYFKILEENKK